MANQGQFGVSSPLSGIESPGSPGGSKIGRNEAKKIFKEKVDKLIAAVKLIPVYAEAFASHALLGGKRSDKLTVTFNDPTGQSRQYQIGRSEYKEFVSQVVKEMQKLTTTAFNLNKTRRKTTPSSGFLAPAKFGPEIVNFFSNANIGPIVLGNFVMDKNKRKAVPDNKTLLPQPNTRLNSLLYFTQQNLTNGRPNPLYSIISPGTLTPLFALHAYHSKMQYPFDATRLSASAEMRNQLAGVMERTIRNDARTIKEKYPQENPQRIDQIAAQFINNIRQPFNLPVHPSITAREQNRQATEAEIADWNNRTNGLLAIGKIGEDEIFNPNYFLYAHFSKLISNGKITGDQGLNETQLVQIRQQIEGAYSGLQGMSPDAFRQVENAFRQAQQLAAQTGQPAPIAAFYENVVLHVQQNYVALARAYKNQVQASEVRKRKAAEKALLKQQQQAQVQQQSLQGVTGFPQVQMQGMPGLPGMQNLPYQSLVSTLPSV